MVSGVGSPRRRLHFAQAPAQLFQRVMPAIWLRCGAWRQVIRPPSCPSRTGDAVAAVHCHAGRFHPGFSLPPTTTTFVSVRRIFFDRCARPCIRGRVVVF